MAIETKTIYGQAFISGDSLLQDVILLMLSGKTTSQSENTIVVVENIWEDLMSDSPKAKSENGHWYWEVDMTDIEDTDKTVKVRIPAPIPTVDLFNNDFEIKGSDSTWTRYWKSRMKKIQDSLYNSTNALQPKEITLPGTKYINQNGDLVVVEDMKAENSNLGDIQNLLISLY